jgi:Mg2+/Co2+ transporter CorB
VGIFIPILLFFSLNALALRSFSRLKLQEAFGDSGREHLIDDFLKHAEGLTLTCGFFRILLNTAIIFVLIELFHDRHYILTFVVALVVIEFCGLLIPHAWAKHAGEYILPRTYRFLKLLLLVLRPVMAIFKLHDRFVRRLAGIQDT